MTPVAVDNPEEGLARDIGRTVSVTATVESVLGPRLFTIVAGSAIAPGHDAIVHVPPPAVVPVRERTTVTATGVVRTLASIDLTHEWGSPETSLAPVADQRRRAVLVADR